MSAYVISINEKTKEGKTLRKKLREQKVKLVPLEKYEAKEEDAIAREIKKAKKTPLQSYEEGKAMFRKLRRDLKS